MLVVMDEFNQEEHLSQPLQTNNKQFKIAVTFLAGYNGIFNATISSNKFYFKKTINDGDDVIQITKPPGAYEIESLNYEIKRSSSDEGQYSENEYPFTIQPNFSTVGSTIQIQPQGPIISFMFDDSIRDLFGFNSRTIYEEYNISPNPVDILSFDNISLECDIAQGMIFRGKRSGNIQNFTMDVDPGYEYMEIFRGNIQWHMMES